MQILRKSSVDWPIEIAPCDYQVCHARPFGRLPRTPGLGLGSPPLLGPETRIPRFVDSFWVKERDLGTMELVGGGE